MSRPGESPVFATTLWGLVADATARESNTRSHALESLCRMYWPPAYAVIRHRGHPPEAAHDLTQEFFASLLSGGFLSAVDRSRGTFRGYLLGALKHFLADAHDRAGAQKRGGGRVVLSIDALQAEESYAWEPVDDRSPDRLLERRWALTLLARAASRLEEESRLMGKEQLFQTLKPLLSESATPGDYPAAAAKLHLSEAAVRMTVSRLRRRFAELVRAEVRETVGSPAEAEEEMRYLLAVLRER